MKNLRNSRTLGIAVPVLAAASLVLASCSSDDNEDASGTTVPEAETSTTAAAAEPSEPVEMTPTGPACAAVPDSGPGSFDGMAEAPAATAASNNPELSTLVTAVTEAGLVDTLNGEGPFTVFAPANSAFDALPAGTLDAVLADKDQLTDILTYHVVAGESLDGEALVGAGSVETVQGGELTVTQADDGTVMVNGSASVVCANIPTANATVHIIDAVLMPGA